jgi:hypothetical protein
MPPRRQIKNNSIFFKGCFASCSRSPQTYLTSSPPWQGNQDWTCRKVSGTWPAPGCAEAAAPAGSGVLRGKGEKGRNKHWTAGSGYTKVKASGASLLRSWPEPGAASGEDQVAGRWPHPNPSLQSAEPRVRLAQPGRDGASLRAPLTQPEVQAVAEASARLGGVQHQVGIPDVEVAVRALGHRHQLQLLDPPHLQPRLLARPGELRVVQLLGHGSHWWSERHLSLTNPTPAGGTRPPRFYRVRTSRGGAQPMASWGSAARATPRPGPARPGGESASRNPRFGGDLENSWNCLPKIGMLPSATAGGDEVRGPPARVPIAAAPALANSGISASQVRRELRVRRARAWRSSICSLWLFRTRLSLPAAARTVALWPARRILVPRILASRIS